MESRAVSDGVKKADVKPFQLSRPERRIVKDIVSLELIEKRIYLAHGQRVMLDRDLAELYGVETRALNQAVRRNKDRFPSDFMFSLNREEIRNISQIVISSGIDRIRP
jgi:hypothetical protein